jgi:CBS domain containing-hemolysin-like protein
VDNNTIFALIIAVLMIIVNGFFVAAEFALVKVRPSRIEQLIDERRPFAKTARWLANHLEPSLSACQLGITMASLALGWVGEPAFSALLRPVLERMHVTSERAVEILGFIFAFGTITSLHLIIGEQAPKIFAIRRPEWILLACAPLLKLFYVVSYPLMMALNLSTARLLKLFGLDENDPHTAPYTEAELRTLMHEAHVHGNVTRSERELIDAVFDFDHIVCRRIMVPRNDVDFIDLNENPAETLAAMKRQKHTRYPVCEGSLDDLVGIVHIKDLIGKNIDSNFDWKSVMRPPKKVPENMPINKLLGHFQATHQHMAFVIDEYGTIIGIVTLENVVEEIVGDVADEFDTEDPEIVPDGQGTFIIEGTTSIEDVESHLGVKFEDVDVDTIGGLLMHKTQRLLAAGDEIKLDGMKARVLSVADDRVTKVRIELDSDGVED